MDEDTTEQAWWEQDMSELRRREEESWREIAGGCDDPWLHRMIERRFGDGKDI